MKSQSLGTELPKEIARCQALLKNYAEIGPAGRFGVAVLTREIHSAVQAMADGDVVAMIRACKALKGCS